MGKTLVVVESPHKAKTIQGFLGSGYVVKASVGHIREIPEPKRMSEAEKKKYSDLGIDVTDPAFPALYKVASGSTSVVSSLKSELAKCDELVLATDSDREGEAISWHVLQVLAPALKSGKVQVSRATWTEITKKAVEEGLAHRRQLDEKAVASATARQAYDRLFGFSISPVLWKTIYRGASGGRVQSPALRLVVERERQRLSFVKASYMSVAGSFQVSSSTVLAKFVSMGEVKVASGSSFGSDGQAAAGSLVVTPEVWAKLEVPLRKSTYVVEEVSTKPYSRKAPPPYTTSSFQQEVGTRLRLSSKQAMSVAQALYDRGLLTYMRTDSVEMAQEGVQAARAAATAAFGAAAVPTSPNVYRAKKNAQAGHEALRPTVDSQGKFQKPSSLKAQLASVDRHAYRVYELVYNRAVASQMKPAVGVTTTITLASTNNPKTTFRFATSATRFTDLGWTALMKPVKEGEEANTLEATVRQGEDALLRDLTTQEHSTTPPARYTEPSLVAKLEEEGLGRPSSYATIVTINQTRGYVKKKGQQLYPTWVGMKVANYLEASIPNFVAYDATTLMEEELDKIEEGSLTKEAFLRKEWDKITREVLPLGEAIDWSEVEAHGTIRVNPAFQVKVTSKGSWLERVADTPDEKGYRPGAFLDDDADLGNLDFTDPAVCEEYFAKATKKVTARDLGELSSGIYQGWTVAAKDGKYGPYLQASPPEGAPKASKPVNHSLPEGLTLEEVTLAEVESLFQEVKLPRTLSDQFFTGIGARGPWLGYKTSAKAKRATFVSLPEGLNPRTLTKEEAEKVWQDKQDAKKAAEAKKAAKKASPKG